MTTSKEDVIEQKKKTNLITKLAEITEEIKRIPKNGYNEFNKYHYMLESDIKEVVRAEMSKRNVVLIGSELENVTTPVTTRKGNTEYQVKITKEMTVYDGDSGETIKFNATGVGQDSGDKAQYKAETGLIKYALNNLFLIPSGDDPESNGKKLQPEKPVLVTELQVNSLMTVISSLMEVAGKTEDEWLAALNNKLQINKEVKDFNLKEYGLALNILNSWKEQYANQKQTEQKRAWD